MVSTPVYDSLTSSINRLNEEMREFGRNPISQRQTCDIPNKIQNEWNKHVKLLNTTYPGYDNIDPTPKNGDGIHIQDWQSSNGQNYLSKLKNTENSLINYTYIYINRCYTESPNAIYDPVTQKRQYLIKMGHIHPLTDADYKWAGRETLPKLTPELYSHPYVIERHNRFGYPISKMIEEDEEKKRVEKDKEEEVKREAEDALIWAANRLPGERPLSNNIVTEYRSYLIKTNKISTINKDHPSYTPLEIEYILHYLTSQNPKLTNIYEKDTIIAMKALNRFAKENNILITENIKRKAIPKKIRGEAWKIQFGDSTKGSCFCCKKELDVFDDWHAGHIVSHSNNGTDTADNLRPVCGSCNLSMGTENMNAFKARCYPN